jgi:xylitol oxidase
VERVADGSWSGTNWAGNVTYAAQRLHRPTTVDELRRVVESATYVRAVGTGHSFNLIANAADDGAGDLVSVAGLPNDVEIDAAARTVTVGASMRYGDLATTLHAAGFALHNLASLPHISVAGAVATGTHGSGDRNGSLSTAVTALEMVTAGGELTTLTRDADGDTFAGSVVALGALGIVTRVTLRIEPTYQVAQWVYDGMPWETLYARLSDVFASAYSVCVLTRWTAPRVDLVWQKHRLDQRPDGFAPPHEWLGATLADGERHPVVGLAPQPCTPQHGVPGPWHERLPHFRLDYTPSVGAEVQSEFFVPREHAVAAIQAVRDIGAHIAPLLRVSELRTVAADDLWLSPAYQRDSLGIHFTWADDVTGVLALLPAIEAALAPFEPRPHWGKLFTMSPESVAARYPRHGDFGRLRGRLDPASTFANTYVDRYAPVLPPDATAASIGT